MTQRFTRLALEQQFARVKAAGWLPYYEAAAKAYGFTPSLLLALTSRETNCRNIIGDGGHGHGLGQIDDRSYPAWCATSRWKDPEVSLHMAAYVLSRKLHEIQVSPSIPVADRIRVALAAYNCGSKKAVPAYFSGMPDKFTTGHDYSKDVLTRERVFAELLTRA